MKFSFKDHHFDNEQELENTKEAYAKYNPKCACSGCNLILRLGLDVEWELDNFHKIISQRLQEYGRYNDEEKTRMKSRTYEIFDAVEDFYENCLSLQDQFPEAGEKDFIDEVLYEMEDRGLIKSNQDLEVLEHSVRCVLNQNWSDADASDLYKQIKQLKENFGPNPKFYSKEDKISEELTSKPKMNKNPIPGSVVSRIFTGGIE